MIGMIEEFINQNNLVVLNDGRPTWLREIQSLSSAIDITMVSAELAAVSGWEVVDQYAMGRDHIPIISKFGRCLIEEPENLTLGFNFKKANWTKYEEKLNEGIGLIDSEHGIEEWNRSFSKYIWSVPVEMISKKKVPRRGSMVPWWDEEYNKAVHARNKAYKKLKRYPLESYVIEYKKLRARARRLIKEAKKKKLERFLL